MTTTINPKPVAKLQPGAIKKTGRIFKAENIKKVAKNDGRCCFFDVIGAVVAAIAPETGAAVAGLSGSLGLDAAATALTGASGVGGALGVGDVAGGLLGETSGALAGGSAAGGTAAGAADAAASGAGGLGATAPVLGADAGVSAAPVAASGIAPGAAAGTAAVAPASVGGASAGGLAGIGAGSPLTAAADPLAGATSGIDSIGGTIAGTSSSGLSGAIPGGSAAGFTEGGFSGGSGGLGSAGALGTTGVSGGSAASSDGLLGGLVSSKNAGLALSAGGLGLSLLNSQKQPTALNNLANTANSQSAQSTQLESFLQKGTLPPGVQNTINLAEKNAEAGIRSKYASFGQSGSTAEAQDIANSKLIAANQGTQDALNLLQQGVSEANLSGQLQAQILAQENQQNNQVSGAIQNFGRAVGGLG